MNKLMLSGYKTYLGLVMWGVGSVLDLIGVSGGAVLQEWGGVLAGVGGFHKILKESGAVKS